jgi:glycosyltransferase involved in cell wall biosynthesis
MPSKNFIVYSTMPSNGWGGSEELWLNFLHYAISQQLRPTVICKFQNTVHPNFKKLSDSGINVIFYKEDVQQNIFSKIFNKLVRFFHNHQNTPHSFFELLQKTTKINPSFILVNQGGTFNFIEDSAFLFLLENYKTSYFLISQHNFEHFSYPIAYLKKLRHFLSYFNTMFFVSARNAQVAYRQLATRVTPNFEIVINPCKIYSAEKTPYPENNDVIKMAFVGRFDCKNKALDLLIEALSDEYFYSTRWQLELWGHGPDKEYIIELISYFGLSDKIKMMDFSQDVFEIWRRNELLVLPSYNEGSPLSIMEAMMCSRACFVTDVGDNEKFIKNGINGYLVPAPTQKLIKQHLVNAFEDRLNWKKLGETAHDNILQIYDPNPGKTLFDKIVKITHVEF